MHMRIAASAACVVAFAVAQPTYAAVPLTLDDAFARVADTHPQLRLFGARNDVLRAELDRVALRPDQIADSLGLVF